MDVFKFKNYGDPFTAIYGSLKGTIIRKAIFERYELLESGELIKTNDRIEHRVYVSLNEPAIIYKKDSLYMLSLYFGKLEFSEDKYGNKNYPEHLIEEISYAAAWKRKIDHIKRGIGSLSVEDVEKIKKMANMDRWKLDKRLGRPYTKPEDIDTSENEKKSSNNNDDEVDELPF